VNKPLMFFFLAAGLLHTDHRQLIHTSEGTQGRWWASYNSQSLSSPDVPFRVELAFRAPQQVHKIDLGLDFTAGTSLPETLLRACSSQLCQELARSVALWRWMRSRDLVISVRSSRTSLRCSVPRRVRPLLRKDRLFGALPRSRASSPRSGCA
jgi:hypothetical protein